MNVVEKMQNTFERFIARRSEGYKDFSDNDLDILISEYSASTMIPLKTLLVWCGELGIGNDYYIEERIQKLKAFYGY